MLKMWFVRKKNALYLILVSDPGEGAEGVPLLAVVGPPWEGPLEPISAEAENGF